MAQAAGFSGRLFVLGLLSVLLFEMPSLAAFLILAALGIIFLGLLSGVLKWLLFLPK